MNKFAFILSSFIVFSIVFSAQIAWMVSKNYTFKRGETHTVSIVLATMAFLAITVRALMLSTKLDFPGFAIGYFGYMVVINLRLLTFQIPQLKQFNNIISNLLVLTGIIMYWSSAGMFILMACSSVLIMHHGICDVYVANILRLS